MFFSFASHFAKFFGVWVVLSRHLYVWNYFHLLSRKTSWKETRFPYWNTLKRWFPSILSTEFVLQEQRWYHINADWQVHLWPRRKQAFDMKSFAQNSFAKSTYQPFPDQSQGSSLHNRSVHGFSGHITEMCQQFVDVWFVLLYGSVRCRTQTCWKCMGICHGSCFLIFFSRALAEANLRKSFGESFAAVVFPFAGPCYFNAPANYLLDAAH